MHKFQISSQDHKCGAGQFIDTWKIGTAPYTFSYGGENFNIAALVSVQGRSNNGTWLPAALSETPATDFAMNNKTHGFGTVWGRAGGWLTAFMQAGSDRDDIFALNGADVSLKSTARVVGYQLAVFSQVGGGSFAFDDTIPWEVYS